MRWATRGGDTAAAEGDSWLWAEAPMSVLQRTRQSGSCGGPGVN